MIEILGWIFLVILIVSVLNYGIVQEDKDK